MLKPLLRDFPKPDHEFLNVEALDASIKNGLPERVGQPQASMLMKGYETLRRAQEKVLHIAVSLMTTSQRSPQSEEGKDKEKNEAQKDSWAYGIDSGLNRPSQHRGAVCKVLRDCFSLHRISEGSKDDVTEV